MKRDLRQYARQTDVQLIAGGIVLLLLVGDGLIYLVYGPAAAVSGLLCIGIGFIPLVLIFLSLALMDWLVKRANRD